MFSMYFSFHSPLHKQPNSLQPLHTYHCSVAPPPPPMNYHEHSLATRNQSDQHYKPTITYVVEMNRPLYFKLFYLHFKFQTINKMYNPYQSTTQPIPLAQTTNLQQALGILQQQPLIPFKGAPKDGSKSRDIQTPYLNSIFTSQNHTSQARSRTKLNNPQLIKFNHSYVTSSTGVNNESKLNNWQDVNKDSLNAKTAKSMQSYLPATLFGQRCYTSQRQGRNGKGSLGKQWTGGMKSSTLQSEGLSLGYLSMNGNEVVPGVKQLDSFNRLSDTVFDTSNQSHKISINPIINEKGYCSLRAKSMQSNKVPELQQKYVVNEPGIRMVGRGVRIQRHNQKLYKFLQTIRTQKLSSHNKQQNRLKYFQDIFHQPYLSIHQKSRSNLDSKCLKKEESSFNAQMAISNSGDNDNFIERQVTGVSDLMFPLDEIPLSKAESVKGNMMTHLISIEAAKEGQQKLQTDKISPKNLTPSKQNYTIKVFTQSSNKKLVSQTPIGNHSRGSPHKTTSRLKDNNFHTRNASQECVISDRSYISYEQYEALTNSKEKLDQNGGVESQTSFKNLDQYIGDSGVEDVYDLNGLMKKIEDKDNLEPIIDRYFKKNREKQAAQQLGNRGQLAYTSQSGRKGTQIVSGGWVYQNQEQGKGGTIQLLPQSQTIQLHANPAKPLPQKKSHSLYRDSQDNSVGNSFAQPIGHNDSVSHNISKIESEVEVESNFAHLIYTNQDTMPMIVPVPLHMHKRSSKRSQGTQSPIKITIKEKDTQSTQQTQIEPSSPLTSQPQNMVVKFENNIKITPKSAIGMPRNQRQNTNSPPKAICKVKNFQIL